MIVPYLEFFLAQKKEFLKSIQMIVGVVVKTVKFLFKIIQYFCVPGHVCGKDKNYHILNNGKS